MALAKPMKDLREYDDEDDDIIESTDENEPKSELEPAARKDL